MAAKRKNLTNEELQSIINDEMQQRDQRYYEMAEYIADRALQKINRRQFRIRAEGAISLTMWGWRFPFFSTSYHWRDLQEVFKERGFEFLDLAADVPFMLTIDLKPIAHEDASEA